MIDESAVTLRLWGRRARRFIRWFATRDRQDRKAMWHLDRLAEALAAQGWRTNRRFHVSPATLRVGPTKHAPATEELSATHFGRWVYLTRSSAQPIPCADLDQAVTEVERILRSQLHGPSPRKARRHERQR
ncbi:hypothetical protein [Actinomadura citrea]|uniref:Uncharacterized protein n=1 Tax=Actinomadura citrea TaxID=46158 RepID=A0A7Y9KCE6_9ACTN|nr:hypothetical protein [Actinomadura citrea]NYE10958.1 hypothetical protein [Actinomadura citrea]GGU07521.1 hypothetical protein GCM10010177_78450 [Actinomadura citrea]